MWRVKKKNTLFKKNPCYIFTICLFGVVNCKNVINAFLCVHFYCYMQTAQQCLQWSYWELHNTSPIGSLASVCREKSICFKNSFIQHLFPHNRKQNLSNYVFFIRKKCHVYVKLCINFVFKAKC